MENINEDTEEETSPESESDDNKPVENDESDSVEIDQKQLVQSQKEVGGESMDTQETRSKPPRTQRREKQILLQQEILCCKSFDGSFKLSEKFKVEQTVGGGDCFFHSVAEGLKLLKPEINVSVKSLRQLCKKFAQRQFDNNQPWLKEALKNEAEQLSVYIPRIEFTVNDIAQNLQSVKLLHLSAPIQGRSEIEGRIICEEYNVKLHVIYESVVEGKMKRFNQITDSDGSRNVDSVDYSEGNIIQIVGNGKGHFKTIVKVHRIHQCKQQSQDYSENDDLISAEEELKKGHDTKKENLKNPSTYFQNQNCNTTLEIDEQSAANKRQAGYDTNFKAEKLKDNDKKKERLKQRISFPYSNELPLDEDLILSNRNFKSVLESDLEPLQNLHFNSAQKLTFCNRPAFPDEYLLVQFASRIYHETKDGKGCPNKMLQGWKLLTTAHNHAIKNQYLGAAYWNPQLQQIVIAHRGTKRTAIGTWYTDIWGILENKYVSQMVSAVTFANEIATVLEQLNKKPNVNLQLTITGHSLGGWLAQITAFTTKYFSIESFAKHPYFVKSEQVGYHAHTVVFDSPGCKDMLCKLRSDFDLRHYKDDNSFSLSSLDITSYLSAPNLVNTCRSHLGTLYRIFIKDLPPDRSRWDFAKYTKKTHSIVKIEKALDPEKGREIKAVIDWPLVKKGITKRAIEKLLDIPHDILRVFQKIVFNQGESKHLPDSSEYEYFHKLARDVNNYNPEPDDKEGYCSIRYQVQDIDETKCSISVFTQPEIEFLRSYQNLRKHSPLPRLESFFSFLDNEATEITAVLRHFEIEENKRTISIISEEEMHILIPYVKNMLHFFPEMKSKLKDLQMNSHVWFDVRDPVHLFSGRQEQIHQISISLKQGIFIISGLAGIGKSELAIKYAHDRCIDSNVIWINGETLDTAKDSLRRLMKELRLKTMDRDGDEKTVELMAKEVFDYFIGKQCLFIIDNAEKYSIIRKFLPSKIKGIHILITSQNCELSNEQEFGKVEILKLDILPKDEAVEFVKEALNINDMQQNVEIEELVETLGLLPLALQHAVAFIKKMGYNQTVGMYVHVYKKSEQEVQYFLNRKCLDTYNKTIFFTFKTTFGKLEQEEDGVLAGEILNVMAYFAPDNIPTQTFLMLAISYVDESDASLGNFRAIGMLTSAIGLLNKYSLINVKEKVVSVHRLVQDVVKLEMRKKIEEGIIFEEQVLAKALGLLKEYMVNQDSENYLPHIISVWNYASKYDKLIEDYIIYNNGREAFTTYFHVITGCSSFEIVKTVLEKISCCKIEEVINARDKERRSSLHTAAAGGNENILKVLIDKGAHVNAKKKHEWTPLHIAAKNGHLKAVQVLLEKHANVNAKTGFKFSPLHLAARDGHSEVVSALLNAKADINAETKYKFTPLHVAAENNQLSVVQALLKAEVNINAKTEYKFTPLHLAAKKGHLEIVLALLSKGGNANALDNGNFTPFHLAAQNGHFQVVSVLLDKLADVNAQTTKGNTALHLAAENNHLQVVEFLMNTNISIDIANEGGKTALNLAEERKNLEVIDYIKKQTFSKRSGLSGTTG